VLDANAFRTDGKTLQMQACPIGIDVDAFQTLTRCGDPVICPNSGVPSTRGAICCGGWST